MPPIIVTELYGKEFTGMNIKASTLVWTFIWSLFMGVTAISIGVGALFPPLNYVAKPFVCPGGTMTVEQQVYTVSPVETVTTLTWYCVNRETGAKSELSMWPMSIASGLIYGLLLFLVILLGMSIAGLRKQAVSATTGRRQTQYRQTEDPKLNESRQLEVAERKAKKN
jgi:hypothetical protein